jgi:uncharacterized tellurite resistance protein B-like protein
MELRDLDQDERLALVALIERVVLADRTVSTDEEQMLPEIVDALGEDAYRKAVTAADERFQDAESLKTFLKGIRREEARELIFGTVMDLAMADMISGNESELLTWLGTTWNVESKLEEAVPEGD